MIRAEHGAQPPESGHHLIGDHQDIVLPEHLLDRPPVAGWRRGDAAGSKHRFADKGGNRVGALALDQRFEIGNALGNETGFIQARVFASEEIRCSRVQDVGERQVELPVKQFKPRQRSGDQPRAVIAAPARDDLLLFPPPQNVVVIPDELHIGLIRIRPAKAEIDLRHVLGRALNNHLRQRDRGFRAVAHIGMVIGKFLRLGGDGLGDFLPPITDIDAVEPGKAVEQAVAVPVLDVNAGAAGHDPVRAFAPCVLGKMGGGMKEILPVPLVELVVA